jgi:hypothetical protein
MSCGVKTATNMMGGGNHATHLLNTLVGTNGGSDANIDINAAHVVAAKEQR